MKFQLRLNTRKLKVKTKFFNQTKKRLLFFLYFIKKTNLSQLIFPFPLAVTRTEKQKSKVTLKNFMIIIITENVYYSLVSNY